ncbi:hypothetical protein HanRHA438_Chr10g0435931 [Helianthus annuus]|nr:hypothetical protein HanRHA438_Chr10g0435931 [Helianthus annuus]
MTGEMKILRTITGCYTKPGLRTDMDWTTKGKRRTIRERISANSSANKTRYDRRDEVPPINHRLLCSAWARTAGETL